MWTVNVIGDVLGHRCEVSQRLYCNIQVSDGVP